MSSRSQELLRRVDDMQANVRARPGDQLCWSKNTRSCLRTHIIVARLNQSGENDVFGQDSIV
jgi:hypothetical protein